MNERGTSKVSRASVTPTGKRLDSWKEIAACLGRDQRTVQRWEKSEGLPVHRHVHAKTGSVYAFQSELDRWRESRRQLLENPAQGESSRMEEKPSKVMLAVLPFENLSGDPEQEYFSDGMTAEMIARMGGLVPGQLAVIARTSAMMFKGTKKGVAEIGRELGVQYVLEGSVQRSGKRARITAQLVAVSDQTSLWGESYERATADLLGIQGQVAAEIAKALAVQLLPAQKKKLLSGRSVDPEAYEAYLKGRYYWNKRTPGGVKKGIAYFQKAIEKDPTCAPAYVGLADSYIVWGGTHLGLSSKETFLRAKAATLKALEIDETAEQAHVALAMVRAHHDWDWAGAEEAHQRALELNPSNATGHQWYADFHMGMNRVAEAKKEIALARELDPLSLVIRASCGRISCYAGEYAAAVRELESAIEIDSQFAVAHLLLAETFEQMKNYERAFSEYQMAIHLLGESPEARGMLGRAYAVAGRTVEAKKMVSVLRELGKERYVSSYIVAIVYAGLGDAAQTFAILEKAYEEKDYWLFFIQVDPRMEALRDEPQYKKLLQRMKFPAQRALEKSAQDR